MHWGGTLIGAETDPPPVLLRTQFGAPVHAHVSSKGRPRHPINVFAYECTNTLLLFSMAMLSSYIINMGASHSLSTFQVSRFFCHKQQQRPLRTSFVHIMSSHLDNAPLLCKGTTTRPQHQPGAHSSIMMSEVCAKSPSSWRLVVA